MTRFRVYPYKQGSKSAKALAEALGGRVLKLEGSKYRQRAGDVVINWGSTTCPFRDRLNSSSSVVLASNKLFAFEQMREQGVSIPDFWTNSDDIPADRYPIVCRTILSGHSGAGIVIADTPADLVRAPLYVAYVKKQQEFRVHVVAGSVVAVQRKALRDGVEEPNWRVRNHANGFIFAREGFEAPQQCLDQSIMAVAALGLDFGGVDVIWNDRQQRAYVLEVNTACGLEGQTVEDYANAFRNL